MFAALIAATASLLVLPHEEKSFVSWMKSTNQMYTGDEYQMRLGIWLANYRYVKEHNGKSSSFKVSMNEFAALTPSEYKVMLGFKGVVRQSKASVETTSVRTHDPIDWRAKGAVTGVKNQGQCGSCWAFSCNVGYEGAIFNRNGTLYDFSESNLVDCCQYAYGCEGGVMLYAYEYVYYYQGGRMMLTSDYPYTACENVCKYSQAIAIGTMSQVVDVIMYDENDLATKVAQYGPAAIAIDASHLSFQLYTSGIYEEPECSTQSLDHGVGCVGYGTDGATAYWIIKNSWGTTWGEEGYIRMLWKDNMCGVASSGCIPLA